MACRQSCPCRQELGREAGKVVLLDFFADWCPLCERMYPVERAMVAEYANRPFALLGVNCDESRETLRQLTAAKVTWRCWWDAGAAPIRAAWQVESYPILYLVDHEGVVRRVFEGAPSEMELRTAVEELVLRAEGKGKATPAAPPARTQPPAETAPVPRPGKRAS